MECTQCIECKHYRLDRRCNAFPRGIPQVILLCEFDHRKPFHGDNGIRFESRQEGQDIPDPERG